MAILNEFKVEVIVDGKPVNEYEDDDDPEPNVVNTATKYVEAVSGKEYSFRITIGPRAPWGGAEFICAKPEIEGKHLSGVCMYPSHGKYDSVVATLDGEWSGGGSNAKLYKYTFADLETRECSESSWSWGI